MVSGTSSPSANSEMIRLADAWKVYKMGMQQVNALAGINTSFSKGSFWAIMGPSGSGKSTMMNILGCLDRLTSGRYYFDGQDISTLNDDALSELRLRRIGFIFQSFNLIPQLTVQKNIELPLYYLGWDSHRSSERARQLAEQVGLGERLGHRPTELSGGQMQRVAIARALANDPQVIFADEPTGNLDTKTGLQILELLQKLHAEGKTIIMVTHEPDIAAFAQYQMHMRDGKIERIDGGEK
ncbi:MAG TPA: ABC transporter ATP-binding protein [Anaerohalosphaeraceae bacterium]|jgi:putative ABC transport system ATP-binding protein|nr:ABC transporter ATP-binding protein [Anaerohalosphaeraceae bacterium]HOT72720.1 ABC transporter ATP-binding protein [Anaerohalosphaeraceae bacterium]HQG04878.1 ABC transporter ATP-binding protein [Anaerohalosphaeraceae bacterium]HQI07413.1 ABC transporter ATP-binding protein [Anaerohalosphaeraceae bacterium]HQJ67687.1 ABC transporter ATP-binding protein [Anaerohalosphaeraceae bacterium]